MITQKAQIKLAILAVYYAFAVEVDASYAQESILSTGEINTFDCQECERELLEEGFLKASITDGKTCYGITDIGSYTYEQGRGIMQDSVLDSFVAQALRHFEYICSGKRYFADILEADGGYYVSCSLRSEKCTYMETKLFFTDKNKAYKAYMNCKERPEMINGGIETLMSGKLNDLF